jgi:hypothetical protein
LAWFAALAAVLTFVVVALVRPLGRSTISTRHTSVTACC